jgi:octanoyl-[GcvH]:protein N-octanoyltransferase
MIFMRSPSALESAIQHYDALVAPAEPVEREGRGQLAQTALLQRAARVGPEPVVRVYRPGPTVAFGRLDSLRPRFRAAAAAARRHGFSPVIRAPGGHAAAYDGGSLCVEQVVAEAQAISGLQDRFRAGAELIAEALRAVGADADVGEVAGEYCPGAWSVHDGGRVKLAGTAQRVVRGASLLGASIVVRGGEAVRAVLRDVNAELGLEWDPATAGAVEDALPGVSVDDVERALVDAYAARGPLREGSLDEATVAAARRLVDRHRL